MNSEAKTYVENILEPLYKNEDIGFLILNRYKKGKNHWDFMDCEIKVVEFNKEHTFIEKVGGIVVEGNGNRDKIDKYIKAEQKDDEYISHQLMWHTHSLKEILALFASYNKTNKELPDLDKKTYTRLELKKVCDKTKEINFETLHTSSERATNCSYGK